MRAPQDHVRMASRWLKEWRPHRAAPEVARLRLEFARMLKRGTTEGDLYRLAQAVGRLVQSGRYKV